MRNASIATLRRRRVSRKVIRVSPLVRGNILTQMYNLSFKNTKFATDHRAAYNSARHMRNVGTRDIVLAKANATAKRRLARNRELRSRMNYAAN